MDTQKPSSTDFQTPTNVSTQEDLDGVHSKYLSGDFLRPLVFTDQDGTKYQYALKPMVYSVIFILIVEALERFSYYGINFTQTSYLTGVYDASWNAGLSGMEASAMTSLSTAIAYSSPFVGAILADALLGDFWVIALGTGIFYIPGMILIALTTIPRLLGESFNMGALRAGLIVLYPLGAGAIKAVVNIFGAKQFHPVLQSAMLSRYYVNFYMFINIGALVGGTVIPIIAQHNVTAAYFIPVATMTLAILVFVLGSPRYVKMRPNKTSLLNTLQVIGTSTFCCQSLDSKKSSNGGKYSDYFVQSIRQLLYVFPITALVIPFNVVYAQISTTFIVQGTVMEKAGFVDASMMQNVDAISVLFFGYIIGGHLYPALEKKGINLSTTHKFAMGTFCATLACICALIIEYEIHATYQHSGEKISILWQSFSFFFVGAGEIFAVSSAYEASYKVAPKEQKALASAINLFLIGGIPNYICMAIDHAVKPWFTDIEGNGDIKTIEAYTTTNVQNFWWLLIGIAFLGCLINVFPWTKNWVARVEKEAADNLVAFEVEGSADPEQSLAMSRAFEDIRKPAIENKEVPVSCIDDSDDEADAELTPTKARSHQFHSSVPADLWRSSDNCSV